MKQKLIISSLLIVAAISDLHPQTLAGPGGQRIPILKDTAQLSSFLDSLYSANSFSGVVAVAKNDKMIYSHVRGMADREKSVSLSPETIFNLGSMNKMFTGVAIMQLVEKNKMDLSDPVSKWLPDYPDKEWADKATIQQLLTHTSGLGDFFPVGHAIKDLYNIREIVDTIGRIVSSGDPTAEMVYSNAGFYLLGYIIEKVSGQDYFDYVKKNILKPAGMKNTFFERSSDLKKFARGYIHDRSTGKVESNEKITSSAGGPAGGAWSNINDLLLFQRALEENLLISKVTFQQMTEIKIQSRMGMGYGFGIGAGTSRNGTKWIGHNGGAAGIAADYTWFTGTGYSVIVLINQDATTNMQVMMASRIMVSEMK